MWVVEVLLLGLASCILMVATDWTDCPTVCTCKWSSGKKSAFCTQVGLTAIPQFLNSELQLLELSGNPIPLLTEEVFKSVGLINLQRIFLKKCQVSEVHPTAFRELTILVEVDLSDNLISTLHQETFTGNDRLRVLYLNGNPLTKVLPAQFPPLAHLKTLELHHCQISSIHKDSFINIPSLEFLSLHANKLTSLTEDVFFPLSKLKSLFLNENSWKCDCRLRGFRNWLLTSNLHSQSLVCLLPEGLKSKLWENISPEEFVCPLSVHVPEAMVQEEPGENVTLKCRVIGDPEAQVSWLFNGKIMNNITQDRVILVEREDGNVPTEKWSVLRMSNVTEEDAGEYTCLAWNVGGQATANVSLILPQIVTAPALSKSDDWFVWAVWGASGSVGVLILIFIIGIAACKLRKAKTNLLRRRKMKLTQSYSEQGKTLIDISSTTLTEKQGESSIEGLASQAEMELYEQAACDPMTIRLERCTTTEPIFVYELSAPLVEPPGGFGSPLYPDLLDLLPHRQPVVPPTDNASYFASLPRRKPVVRAGLQYDNMGPRVTADGSSTLSLQDKVAAAHTSLTLKHVEYVSL